MPPPVLGTVALSLTWPAERRKSNTPQRRLSAIAQVHKAAGFDSPTAHPIIRNRRRGIRRAKGTTPDKTRALTADIRAIAARSHTRAFEDAV